VMERILSVSNSCRLRMSWSRSLGSGILSMCCLQEKEGREEGREG
jgi:hypothetical protein